MLNATRNGPGPWRTAHRERRLAIWICLLYLAELADLITTHADRARGGVEANQFAAWTLEAGGPVLFWALKLGLVVAMGCVVLRALRLRRLCPGGRAEVTLNWVERGLQACALALTLVAVSNLAVLAQLPAAHSGM